MQTHKTYNYQSFIYKIGLFGMVFVKTINFLNGLLGGFMLVSVLMSVLFFLGSGYVANDLIKQPCKLFVTNWVLFMLYFLAGSYFFLAALGQVAS
jgi:hypothetical protein